jgi:hypothetical protein
MPEYPEIKRATDYQRLDDLENRMVQMQIDRLSKDLDDHEKRLRLLEEAATKFNFILYLTMGGGLVSLIDLALLVFLLVRALSTP